MTYGQRRNLSLVYNPFTIHELQMTFPFIDWFKYFNWILPNTQHLDENESVIVVDTNYLHQLNDLLKVTPNRTIANYFAFRLVLISSGLLSDVLHNRKRQLFNAPKLTKEIRLADCIKKALTQ